MTFMVGGRACGKTTFLRNAAFNYARAGEDVQIVVANKERAHYWEEWLASIPDEDWIGRPVPDIVSHIKIVTPSDFDFSSTTARRFVDDAEEVLSQLLHGYDIAVASGELFGR